MGLPEVYCSVCGASFGNPYSSLVDDPDTAYLVQGHTDHDFEWLHDAQLFGIPSSLETFEEMKPVMYADMPAYKRTDEHPAFFGDPYCHYGEGNAFHLGGRTYPTHYPINSGDILFAMHSSCANIIKRVFAAKQDGVIAKDGLPTLRTYYDKLRQQCPGYVDEWWNIHWPHEYYGACDYWGYDDWEYAKGCQKFLVDPLHDKNLTTFILKILKPAQPREEALPLLSKASNRRANGLDSLPTEIIDQVVALLPTASALSLRLASPTFATRIPLTQQFFREQLLGGNLVPYLWDLDVKACRDMQQGVPEGKDPDEYWDWRQLARYLNDVAGIVEHDPDSSGIPRGFWNRCRLWLTVVETEVCYENTVFSQSEADMKNALHRGNYTYISIYVVDRLFYPDCINDTETHIDFDNNFEFHLYKTKGFTHFPVSDIMFYSNYITDAVMPSHNAVWGANLTGKDLGSTAVHEIGRWSGLGHTFLHGCVRLSDGIEDSFNSHRGVELWGVQNNGVVMLGCTLAEQVHGYGRATFEDRQPASQFS